MTLLLWLSVDIKVELELDILRQESHENILVIRVELVQECQNSTNEVTRENLYLVFLILYNSLHQSIYMGVVVYQRYLYLGLLELVNLFMFFHHKN